MYIADCLQLVSQNTAKYAGGSYVGKRFADLIPTKPADKRSGEEIAADVIKNAGLSIRV